MRRSRGAAACLITAVTVASSQDSRRCPYFRRDFAAAKGTVPCAAAGEPVAAADPEACRNRAAAAACEAWVWQEGTRLCTALEARMDPHAAPETETAVSGHSVCADYELVAWGGCAGEGAEPLQPSTWLDAQLGYDGTADRCGALCDGDGDCVGYATGEPAAGRARCGLIRQQDSGAAGGIADGSPDSGTACFRKGGIRYAETETYSDAGPGCCDTAGSDGPLSAGQPDTLQGCKDLCEQDALCRWVSWRPSTGGCTLHADCGQPLRPCGGGWTFMRVLPQPPAPEVAAASQAEVELATRRRADPLSWASQTGCPMTFTLHNETISSGTTSVKVLTRLSGWVGHEGWNSGAHSVEHPILYNSLVYGVQFQCANTDKHVMVGLKGYRSVNVSIAEIDNYNYPDIDYAMYCAAGTLRVVEGGLHRGSITGDASYTSSDVLQVRTDDLNRRVEYVKNGVVKYTTSVDAFDYPIGAEASMHSVGAQITNFQWLGCSDTPPTCIETIYSDSRFCTRHADKINQDSLTHSCFGRRCVVDECCKQGLRAWRRPEESVIAVGTMESAQVHGMVTTLMTTSTGMMCYEQGEIMCRAFERNPATAAPVTGLTIGSAVSVSGPAWSARLLGGPTNLTVASVAVSTLSPTKVVVCYAVEVYNATCNIVQVSGTTTLTVGPPAVFNQRITEELVVAALTHDIAVVCYRDSWDFGGYWANGTCNVLQVLDPGDVLDIGADIEFSPNPVRYLALERMSDTQGILCYSGDARQTWPGSSLTDQVRPRKGGQWGGYEWEPEVAGATASTLDVQARSFGLCKIFRVHRNNSEQASIPPGGGSGRSYLPAYGGLQETAFALGKETVFAEVDVAHISVAAVSPQRAIVCYADNKKNGTGGWRDWHYDGEYGICKDLYADTSTDAIPDPEAVRDWDRTETEGDVHAVSGSMHMKVGSTIVVQEANVRHSSMDHLPGQEGVVVCWVLSGSVNATAPNTAFGACNEISLLRGMPHHAGPDIPYADASVETVSVGVFESARYGVAIPGSVVATVCYTDAESGAGKCNLITDLSPYPETITRTPTMTKPTITATPLATQTTTLVYAYNSHRNRFSDNVTLSEVGPLTRAVLSPRHWVDPPYSLRVQGGSVQVRLSGVLHGVWAYDGVKRPGSLSWWFRIRGDTPGVLFSVATDWEERGGIKSHPDGRPHLSIEASPAGGLYVDSQVRRAPCPGHMQLYGVLHDTWHHLEVSFDWGSENYTLGVQTNVSLDGALVCPPMFWNNSHTTLRALHIDPHRPEPYAACSDLIEGRTCVDATGYSDLAHRQPGCDDSEHTCRQCCVAAAKAAGRPGCCSFRATPAKCTLFWGAGVQPMLDSREWAGVCGAHGPYNSPCVKYDETANGAVSGVGWVPERITDAGSAGLIHGVFGHPDKELLRVINITGPFPSEPRSHRSCIVSFRSWATHSRDGDYNRLFIDSRQVWRLKATKNGCGNGWRTGPSDFPHISTQHPACFVDVTVQVPCGESIELRFTADVDQWVHDEGWAVSDFVLALDDCGLEKGAVYVDDVAACETAGCAPWHGYRPFDCEGDAARLGFRARLFGISTAKYVIGDPLYGASYYRLEYTERSIGATIFEFVGWTGEPSQTIHIRETVSGRYLVPCDADNGTISWAEEPSAATEWVFEFQGEWAPGSDVAIHTPRGPVNSDGSNARLLSDMLGSTYEGRCHYSTDWAPGRWLLEPVALPTSKYGAASPSYLASTGPSPPHPLPPRQTPWGSGHRCNAHPRCTWHTEKQVCVEHPLSEVVGAWAETRSTDLSWDYHEMLSTKTGWTAVGEAGPWTNGTGGGATAACDGASCPTAAHPTAVLRSPYFYLGWLSEIEVTLTTYPSSAGFADATGPVQLNGTAFSGGFLGVALHWHGGWVATKRACVDAQPCTVRFERRELKQFVHQNVSVDIVDNAAGSSGVVWVWNVAVTYPSSGVPADWISATSWLQGRPCGAGSWQGVTCDLPSATVVGVQQPGYWHSSYILTGDVQLIDWSPLGNLTTLDLSDNALNGSATYPKQLESLLPLGMYNLSLGGNGMSGDLPSIQRLWYMEHMNLSHNEFTGQIPEHYLVSPYSGYPDQPYGDRRSPGLVGSPYGLKYLDLANMGIAGTIPPGLARHGTLQILNLSTNSISGTIPSPLGPSLYTIDVHSNRLTGVAPLRVPGWTTGLTDAQGNLFGLSVNGTIDLSQNELYGLVPEWIQYAHSWELHTNSWCCPLPHWTRVPAPHETAGRPASLAWAREQTSSFTPLTCSRVALSADPSLYGVCPTIAGPCDGSVWCGHQVCDCDDGPQGGHIVGASQDGRCPGYRGCGCDMRRLRCVYRPEAPTWCNFTLNGICIDDDHYLDYTPHPGLNPYYGDTDPNRYHG
eukprot:TRINITY_DN3174_c0_g4_i1.p1 TRINITY_DN3174_c0_g4~~TRINITY_DN3174_c0_g4_i1.p1  ORF type:complete len:2379 (+),score=461.01 TRINITY_DN3174_c0_g4_i1:98-7234(+)